jgi:hypothetical protein
VKQAVKKRVQNLRFATYNGLRQDEPREQAMLIDVSHTVEHGIISYKGLLVEDRFAVLLLEGRLPGLNAVEQFAQAGGRSVDEPHEEGTGRSFWSGRAPRISH